ADPEELALERPPLDAERHLLREVSPGDGLDNASELRHGMDEVVDQRVHLVDAGRPGPGRTPKDEPLGESTLLSHLPRHTVDLSRRLGDESGAVVERDRDPARKTRPAGRQANVEIAVLQSGER